MQHLGTPPRHSLAESLSTTFFTQLHTERQGMGMQILHRPASLLGALMPKPAQNSSCPGFTPWATLNAVFIAHCVERDISPALDHLSHQGSLQSRGRWAAPNTKTSPPGCRCPHLLATDYKAQLSSSLGTAESVF